MKSTDFVYQVEVNGKSEKLLALPFFFHVRISLQKFTMLKNFKDFSSFSDRVTTKNILQSCLSEIIHATTVKTLTSRGRRVEFALFNYTIWKALNEFLEPFYGCMEKFQQYIQGLESIFVSSTIFIVTAPMAMEKYDN